MDAMLQRHCARYIYIVPDGLRELMTDISREVLRSQPEDMYTFIADYLDALLITRENARVSAKFVEYLTETVETTVDLLKKTGLTREQADQAAQIIQETFKAWSSKRGILKETEDEVIGQIIEKAGITELQEQAAAVCIQHAFRAFKMRKERQEQLLGGVVDWRVAARSAIKLYRKAGVSPEEAKRAANLIKAAYKGYYTRRAIAKLNQPSTEAEEAEEESSEEYYSDTSSASDAGDKKKGVRIDYQSVVPHVDFGDEELIAKDHVSVDEEVEDHKEEEEAKEKEEAKEEVPEEVKEEEKTEEAVPEKDEIHSVEFIQGLLDELMIPIGEGREGEEEEEMGPEIEPEEPVEIDHKSSQIPSQHDAVAEELDEEGEGATEAPTDTTTEATAEPTTEATAEPITEAEPVTETTEG